MKIISISLDKETLEELNEVQKNLGFKSRSKMLRSTVDALLNEYKVIDALEGLHDIVFVITYKEGEKNHVSSILHEFENVIKTTIHQHNMHLCLDILNINADADMIRKLFGTLKRNKCVRSVNFTLLGH